MSELPGDGDGADGAREQIVRTTQRAANLQIALIGMAALAVVMSSASAVVVGLGNRAQNTRVRDCTEPQGRCYQQTQAATAAAVQAILDHIDRSMVPHRLRNEAENICQVELFAGTPAFAAGGVRESITEYSNCVLRRSGNTAPPPLPPNPLTTTTTGG